VLRVQTNNVNATVAFTLIPTKTDEYISDDFSLIMSGMLPFFMLLIYILPMYRLISNIVSEKETKARESMKMMGLNDFSYWLSWFVYYTVIVTLISVLVIIVLSFNVLKYSNRGLVFLFFWVYGMSLFGLAILLQAFFSKARVAAITGTLVYFGTSFVNVAVADKSVNSGAKNLASLLTPVAVNLGSAVLA
jgi:ATP-binding cassette, subfamily A (ABC1), member 3